jgi:hypothetical protein
MERDRRERKGETNYMGEREKRKNVNKENCRKLTLLFIIIWLAIKYEVVRGE